MGNTIAQQRSNFALQKIKEIPANKEFATLAAGLPAMILQNGFAQSLAFLVSKSTDKNGRQDKQKCHYQAFAVMVAWLKERNLLSAETPSQAIEAISSMSQSEYLRSQEETLKVLEWVKRYANSALFLDKDGG